MWEHCSAEAARILTQESADFQAFINATNPKASAENLKARAESLKARAGSFKAYASNPKACAESLSANAKTYSAIAESRIANAETFKACAESPIARAKSFLRRTLICPGNYCGFPTTYVRFQRNENAPDEGCFMYLFLFLLILVSIVPGQSLDKGWKGIEPLKTSKAEVEKILGKPEIDDNGYHGFRTAQGFIQVNYSTEPCRPNAYNRGRFNVPKDKVLDYIVNLTTPIRLTQLDVKLAELDRESNDLEGLYHYSSRDGSVFITTSAENGVEYVGRIVFRPKNTDAKKYPCKG